MNFFINRNMSSAKPKNGKTSSQDYVNLLYSDSESDSVPDLKLPPLRGKKTRKRGLRRQSDDSICSLWMLLKIVIVAVLLFSIVALGVVTYLTLQQISDLKDQINTCASPDPGGAPNQLPVIPCSPLQIRLPETLFLLLA